MFEYIICAFLIILFLLFMIFLIGTSKEADFSCDGSENYFFDPQKDENILFPNLNGQPTLDLSIIIPAYNEEERLPIMMEETLDYMINNRCISSPLFKFEIIIVDDGSTDKTSEIGLKYSKKFGSNMIRVLTQSKNRGKGGAVRMGMLRARGKLLLFADADGATKISDLQKLELELEKICKFNEDSMAIACGSRAHLEKESISNRSLLRTILMHSFHFLVWFLCVRGVRDTQCGFKLFTRPAALFLFTNLHVQRWAFDVDILHIAQTFKIPVAEVAVNWTEIPGSKLSPLLASIQMARDLILIRLRYMTGLWRITPISKLK